MTKRFKSFLCLVLCFTVLFSSLSLTSADAAKKRNFSQVTKDIHKNLRINNYSYPSGRYKVAFNSKYYGKNGVYALGQSNPNYRRVDCSAFVTYAMTGYNENIDKILKNSKYRTRKVNRAGDRLYSCDFKML